MAGRGGLARVVSFVVAAGVASAPRPSAEADAGGAISSDSRPSLVHSFERIFNPGEATPPAGSAAENLTRGYRLLNQAGNLPWDRMAEKRALLEQASQAARVAGDATLIYQTSFFLATVLRQQGENARALTLLEENVSLVRRANLPFNAESAIGGHLAAVGDVEGAVEVFRGGLQTARQNHYDVANAERRLAVALMMAKRFDEAREAIEDALRTLARERLGDGAMEVFAPLNGVIPSAEERSAAEMMARTAKLRAQLIAAGAPSDMVKSTLPERLGAFERSRIDRWLDFSRLREWTAALQGRPGEAFALAQIGRKELLDTTWFLDDTWLDHVSERKSRPTLEVLAQARLAARRLRTTIVEYSPLFSLAPNLPVLHGNPPRLEGVLVWVISRDGRFTQRTVKSDAALGALASLLRDPDGVLAVARSEAAPQAPLVAERARGFTLAGRSGPATSERDPLVDLYQLLIQPIEDLLPSETAARVVLVPRDELLLVPFAALTDRHGRQLVDRYSLWTAP
ncbi:MAG TPA: CHAT domain-containing protein, partial [Solirubrobacteraceae bacterium]